MPHPEPSRVRKNCLQTQDVKNGLRISAGHRHGESLFARCQPPNQECVGNGPIGKGCSSRTKVTKARSSQRYWTRLKLKRLSSSLRCPVTATTINWATASKKTR